MAKLPSLITNATTGEAISYYNGINDNWAINFKQVFQVTKNDNYTWTIKSQLYVRLNPNFPRVDNARIPGVWQRIASEYFRYSADIQFLPNTGIWINGNQVSNNAYNYYKIMENFHCKHLCRTGCYHNPK